MIAKTKTSVVVFTVTIAILLSSIIATISLLRSKSSDKNTINTNTTNYDKEPYNICRVGIIDIELNSNGLHVGNLHKNSEEAFICEIVDIEYGIFSDDFLQIQSLQQEAIEQNMEQLMNQTWYIQYTDDQMVKSSKQHGTPFLVFNTTTTNNTYRQDDTIRSLSQEEVEQIIIDRAATSSSSPTAKTNLRRANNVNGHTRNLISNIDTTGEKTVIVVLVDGVRMKEEEAYEYVFGTGDSLASQMDGCSGSQLTIVPHPTNPIIHMNLNYDLSTYTYSSIITESRLRISRILGVSYFEGIQSQADYYIYIVPDNLDKTGSEAMNENSVAWAYMFGYFAMILESWTTSVQPIMHEFGHMLGNPHTFEAGHEYGDTTTVMGHALRNSRLCFNGQNAWRMGWFQDGRKEISASEIREGTMATIAFYGDYNQTMNDSNQNVVFKIGHDLYLTYNRKKGINAETAEYPDMLLIVQEKIRTENPSRIHKLNIYSDLIGVIENDGDQFVLSDYIKQNNQDGDDKNSNQNLDLIIEICSHSTQDEENNNSLDSLTIAVGTNDSRHDRDSICH